MFIKQRQITLITLCALALVMVSFACGGERDAAPPQSKPGETIDTKGEEKGSEESTGMSNIGLLDSPRMPFDLGKPYFYDLTHKGEPVGSATISVNKMVGEKDFQASCNKDILVPGRSKTIYLVMTDYLLSENLRPKLYVPLISWCHSSPRAMKSIIFMTEPISIVTKLDPCEEESTVVEVESPFDDTWPFDAENILSVAMLLACVDPQAEDVVMWVLDVNSGRLGRLSLHAEGVEPIKVDGGQETLMARRYTAGLDGLGIASYLLSPDGLLIAVDQPGGFHAEFKKAGIG